MSRAAHTGEQSSLTRTRSLVPTLASTEEPPDYTGDKFCSTERHDTYPAIDPTKADLSGKVVLITGASKGIGRAIAIAYAQAGVSGLVLLARSKSGLEETQKACVEALSSAKRPQQKELEILPLAVSITETAAVADALKQVRNTFGRLDIVVNNAGLLDDFKLLGEVDPMEWWAIWEVNIKGLFNVTRAALPLLIECDGERTIVNITSVGAHLLAPGISAYQTSKQAIIRLSELISVEYGDKGIVSYAIHPGGIVTDMGMQLPEEWKHVLVDTAELASHTIVYYSKERRDWLSGRYLSAQWDVDELMSKKEEIVRGDKLKVRMIV